MRLLSCAARLILIQVVTSATPLYVMQSCKLPARGIEQLERCNLNFFWGGSDQRKSIHLVVWTTIYRPKVNGVLGLRPLRSVNQVLLAKLGWKGLTNPNKLWAQVLIKKYGRGQGTDNPERMASSVIWKGMQWGYQLLT